jgi:phosphopentomutase
MPRAIILVIDGFGLGHAPDAEAFGDVNANTFANLAEKFQQNKNRSLKLPNLSKLGLVKACKQASNRTLAVEAEVPDKGAYGYAAEISTGKDTPSGHWEMAGVPVLFDWTYFSDKKIAFLLH